MRNWEEYVRKHLSLPELKPGREARIVRELAAQLEDFYREALSRGLREEQADRYARQQVQDWRSFAREVQFADRAHAEPAPARLSRQAQKAAQRKSGRWNVLADLLQDLRFALRQLRKSPGFTVVAVLTLALGIGANTAIFSVVNGVLLRSLPYHGPERLVAVYAANEGPYFASTAEYLEIRERQKSFLDMAVFEAFERGKNLTGAGEPVHAYTHEVSGNFFSVLGVQAVRGRTFTEADAQPGNERVVVLRHEFWTHQFGQDPGILGKTILLNDESYIVLGVLPPGFRVPQIDTDIWLPKVLERTADTISVRGSRPFFLIGRLKPGVSREQAAEDLRRINAELAAEYPLAFPEELPNRRAVAVRSVEEIATQRVATALLILLVAVGLVLFIACANVANLVLSRTAAREREVAVRAALGAGRGRIIRQLLTESVLLSLAGGAAGILLAYWSLGAIVRMAPESFTDVWEISLDLRVLAFALGLSFLTGALFGLAPAVRTSRVALNESLKEGGHSGVMGRKARLRNVLVVSEVALSLILLVSAGLLLTTLYNLLHVDAGFQIANVQTFRMWLPESRYRDVAQVNGFYATLLEKLRALPGVVAAGASSRVQLSGTGSFAFMPEGFPRNFTQYDIPYGLLSAKVRGVTPGYFRALEIPLLQGRTFARGDVAGAPWVLIVDEEFARQAWPAEASVVGKRVAVPNLENGEHQWRTVVGLVRHAHSFRFPEAELPQVYIPHAQVGGRVMHVVVKTSGDPAGLLPGIRREVASLDASLPMYQVRELQFYAGRRISYPRFYAQLMGLFAGLALMLSVVGLYGVVSYSVVQRTREFGIRMTLGAHSGDLLRLVLRQGSYLTVMGLAVGAVAAAGLTRLLESLLFGVKPADPATFAAVSLLVLAAALLACYVPARRAAQVDPMQALRHE